MKRTALQRLKDKARNKVRRRRGWPSSKEDAAMEARPGNTRFTAILNEAAKFFHTSGSISPFIKSIPMRKSLEEYFDDIDKELANLPECDRTIENRAILLANIIKGGLGAPAIPLKSST